MENKVLATVAGYEITENELNHFIENMPQEQRSYMSNPQARTQLLEQIIQLHLFSVYAKDEKLQETEEFKTVIAKVQDEILSNMAVSNTIKAAVVTEAEISDFYNDNTDKFVTAPSASAKHILVKDESECLDILEKITSSELSFEDAAKAYSTCPSKENGGALGTFGRGQMVPEFDKAVFEGEAGKVIGPVKTQFGYHLILIDELIPSQTQPLEAVKDQIYKSLLQSKQRQVFDAKVKELESKYCVERK